MQITLITSEFKMNLNKRHVIIISILAILTIAIIGGASYFLTKEPKLKPKITTTKNIEELKLIFPIGLKPKLYTEERVINVVVADETNKNLILKFITENKGKMQIVNCTDVKLSTTGTCPIVVNIGDVLLYNGGLGQYVIRKKDKNANYIENN